MTLVIVELKVTFVLNPLKVRVSTPVIVDPLNDIALVPVAPFRLSDKLSAPAPAEMLVAKVVPVKT